MFGEVGIFVTGCLLSVKLTSFDKGGDKVRQFHSPTPVRMFRSITVATPPCPDVSRGIIFWEMCSYL